MVSAASLQLFVVASLALLCESFTERYSLGCSSGNERLKRSRRRTSATHMKKMTGENGVELFPTEKRRDHKDALRRIDLQSESLESVGSSYSREVSDFVQKLWPGMRHNLGLFFVFSTSLVLFHADRVLALETLDTSAATIASVPFESSAREALLLVILQPTVQAALDGRKISFPFGPNESPTTLSTVALATLAAIKIGAIREMAVLLVMPLWARKISALSEGRKLASSQDASIAVATLAATVSFIAAR
jgi:hypothetical protein